MTKPQRTFPVLGLDLGQAQDYSALCLIEPKSSSQEAPRDYYLRTLKRWQLGTAYTTIAADLARFLGKLAETGARPQLVADVTGCGQPVFWEIIFLRMREACVPVSCVGVTITAGGEASLASTAHWRVAKKLLVSTVQVLLQARRLHIAPALPETQLLLDELRNFRVKITPAANETFEAWRERDHDDLVLAVALACWAGERLRWLPR